MKTLKYILNESLLDDADDIFNNSFKELIENYLKNNYDIKNYKISDEPDKDGKYIVDCEFVYVKNTKIKTLTNNVFKFGVVGGYFNCSCCNSLKSLEGAPKEVGWSFYCDQCKSLTSLKGAPKVVGRDFNCYGCDSLKSLEGAPKEVGGYFNCSSCTSLKTLEGAPKEVGRYFSCSDCNSLKTLEGAPKEVGGDFYCKGCSITFDIKDIKKYSNVKGKIRV